MTIVYFASSILFLLALHRLCRKPLDIRQTDKWFRMSAAKRGRKFEVWCAELLRRNAFWFVRICGQSGDQGVDIIAWKWYRGWFRKFAFQCKCYSHPLGNGPVQEINTGMEIVRATVGVVMTNSTFTRGAVTAAKKAGRDHPILLWNRRTLVRMCR